MVAEFEERLSVEFKRQENINRVTDRDFRREELLEKYTVKILYKCNNRKIKVEYLRKLERNW